MARIQLRRGTATWWLEVDPVLAAGEPGFETDSGMMKVGNGLSTWTELPYIVSDTASLEGNKGDILVSSEGEWNINPGVITQNHLAFLPATQSDLDDYVPLEAQGATIGTTRLEGNDLVIEVDTPWGIGTSGPYYDPGNVTEGEEALFSIDTNGVAGWILISEVN